MDDVTEQQNIIFPILQPRFLTLFMQLETHRFHFQCVHTCSNIDYRTSNILITDAIA